MFQRQVIVHDSAVVRCLQYDKDNEILRVHFTTGRKYDYMNVPMLIFGTLVTSESIGKAYNVLVKGKYEIKELATV